MKLDFDFDSNSYGMTLQASQDTLIFAEERVEYDGKWNYSEPIAKGHRESFLSEAAKGYHNKIPEPVFPEVKDLVVYHFHDTSDSSPAKQTCNIDDNAAFRRDAANLPAYLYWLQEMHEVSFSQIEEHIRLVAPFFDSFALAPLRLNPQKIKLEWRQKGSDAYFDAYSLSDGTLRFICLATLLLQPVLPRVILLDEPELGLHPFALRILAEMLEAASQKTQVIVATQSVTLLNHCSLSDVIVAQNDGLKTTLARLDGKMLEEWLQNYSLGELWEKNLIGGRP